MSLPSKMLGIVAGLMLSACAVLADSSPKLIAPGWEFPEEMVAWDGHDFFMINGSTGVQLCSYSMKNDDGDRIGSCAQLRHLIAGLDREAMHLGEPAQYLIHNPYMVWFTYNIFEPQNAEAAENTVCAVHDQRDVSGRLIGNCISFDNLFELPMHGPNNPIIPNIKPGESTVDGKWFSI